MIETNANSTLLSKLLQKAKHGTFTGLITTKQGVTRGRGSEKKVYGNDQVHTLILTGFDYGNLIRKSLAQLPEITEEQVIAKAAKKGVTLDAFTVAAARAELQISFEATLAGTNEATTDHVYEPLKVEGEAVVGGRVYKCVKDDPNHECKCRDCTGDVKAPLNGTIYLQGLKIWSKVLTPAPNGPVPAANSAPKTVAKDILRGLLPVGRYVSYRLEPKTPFMLKAGGTACIEANERGFQITDEVFEVLAS